MLYSLFLLTLSVGAIAAYSFVRYGFLANPAFLIESFPSSSFLEKTLREKPQSIFSIAFSPDHKFLVSGGDRLTIWDVSSGQKIRTIDIEAERVNAVALSPNGQILASYQSTENRGSTQLQNLATGSAIVTLEQASLPLNRQNFAFSSDSKRFVNVDFRGNLNLIDVTTGKLIRTVVSDRAVRAISSAFEGQTLTYATSNQVRQLDFKTGKVTTIAKMQSLVLTSTLSADGKQIALARALDFKPNRLPQSIELWNVSARSGGQKVRILTGNDDWIDDLAFSPDGKRLASASTLR